MSNHTNKLRGLHVILTLVLAALLAACSGKPSDKEMLAAVHESMSADEKEGFHQITAVVRKNGFQRSDGLYVIEAEVTLKFVKSFEELSALINAEVAKVAGAQEAAQPANDERVVVITSEGVRDLALSAANDPAIERHVEANRKLLKAEAAGARAEMARAQAEHVLAGVRRQFGEFRAGDSLTVKRQFVLRKTEQGWMLKQ